VHRSFELEHQFGARRWDSNRAPSASAFFAVASEICPFSFVIGGSASGVVVDCIFESELQQ